MGVAGIIEGKSGGAQEVNLVLCLVETPGGSGKTICGARDLYQGQLTS